jgi:hypothetical protein
MADEMIRMNIEEERALQELVMALDEPLNGRVHQRLRRIALRLLRIDAFVVRAFKRLNRFRGFS